MRRMVSQWVRSFTCVMLAVSICGAADKNSDKKVVAPTSVDTGTFTIIVSGRKVASETFHVDQHPDGSTISSELKTDDPGLSKAVQNSEMSMQPNGLLKKYTWKEVTPGKSQIVVEPQDESFMVSHVTENPTTPAKDTVHALAPGTSIMDENFYSHMEVLTWKYMAFGCKLNAQGQTECKWLPLRMPIFVPHQQQSAIAEMTYTGMTKLNYNGKEAEFKTFSLVLEDPSDFKAEGGNCLLWFNDQNKLVRVLIASDNMEVLRD
jgi:hypothetical protein